jgi:hypothetical protein
MTLDIYDLDEINLTQIYKAINQLLDDDPYSSLDLFEDL